uniref:Uncharacterized protein n=1 Tax=Anopheles coluzzii TaxID=1518534 RepID=A0A8W7PP61_ANOCL
MHASPRDYPSRGAIVSRSLEPAQSLLGGQCTVSGRVRGRTEDGGVLAEFQLCKPYHSRPLRLDGHMWLQLPWVMLLLALRRRQGGIPRLSTGNDKLHRRDVKCLIGIP